MKKTIYTGVMLCVAASVYAGYGLDLGSRATLRKMRIEAAQGADGKAVSPLKKSKAVAVPVATDDKSEVMALVRLADGATQADLESEGINVLKVRGDIAIVMVPMDDVERAAGLESVKQLQVSRDVYPKMNLAREVSGIDYIHAGEGLPQAYTGEGVVTGIVDSGIDPNHINFKNEDGSSRISQLSYVRANAAGTGILTTFYKPGDATYDLADFTSDGTSSYHGSHTMGIMAGGYRGNLTYSERISEKEAQLHTDEPNPFYGVAYNSDIVASCGTLGDGYIAYGCEYILEYAYEHQKPAVINLSLGSNTGGHDGKDMMNEYLTLAGEEAIICVSAGNEGDYAVALHKEFTEDDTQLKAFFNPFYYSKSDFESTDYYKINYGAIYVYSQDATPLDVQVVIYNKTRGRVAQRFVCPTNASGEATYYVSSTDYQSSSDDVVTSALGNYFNGYIGLGSALDEGSGRYYSLLDVYVQPNWSGLNANEEYLIGMIVNGSAGQRADCYSDALATDFTSNGIEGWTDGDYNGSINSMACGDNIIVVGSYNTRDDFGGLDGNVYGYSTHYWPGEISDYSSYGTLIDGRNLPHVCAPGASVISSSNNYYLYESSNGMTQGIMSAKLVNDERDYYWQIAAGTSMATPVVAGSIALWLEADPTLTVADVKEIIEQTAKKDSYVTDAGVDPVKWGAGKFDAYEGLKEVLRRAGTGVREINSTTAADRLLLTSAGNNYHLFLAGEDSLNVSVYSAAGQQVMRVNIAGDEGDLDVSSLEKGIYILNVNGHHSAKIVVK